MPHGRLRGAGDADWSFRRRATMRASPGADRDALPRALGAGARLLRAPRACSTGATERTVHDTGASSFLYPFLGEQEHDLEAVVADVRALGADEGRGGSRRCASRRWPRRAPTVGGRRAGAALQLRRRRTLLALGNGGSATDAMDFVADLRGPPGWPPARARPHRGLGDPHRDRQRHRHRRDLLAAGHRLRASRATWCSRSRRAATRAT